MLTKMTIDDIINLNLIIPEDSRRLLKNHISEVSFQKNHILMHTDRIENNIYFIKKVLVSRISMNATKRYLQLLKQTPDLLLRVQLGHIASYLGITQVSLSRIRAEIR